MGKIREEMKLDNRVNERWKILHKTLLELSEKIIKLKLYIKINT